MHPPSRLCVLLMTMGSIVEFYKSIFPILLGFFLLGCARSLKILTPIGDFGRRCSVFGYRSNVCNILASCAQSLKILTPIGDFGRRFTVFGYSSNVCYVLLLIFVVFRLGLRVLKRGTCDFKLKSRDLKKSRSEERNEDVNRNNVLGEKEESKDEEEEVCDEDKVFDVITLRKMVKAERSRADAALRDLDKERKAAASAADEAMAMIFRLQAEKSALQIESKQLQRLAEERHIHDQEVIQSMQHNLMLCEEEMRLLEQRLNLSYGESRVLDSISSPRTPSPIHDHSVLTRHRLQISEIGPLDPGHEDGRA